MKNKKQEPITHEDIQQALKKFHQNGGLIIRLPDEKKLPRHLVGSKWGTYDLVNEGFEIIAG